MKDIEKLMNFRSSVKVLDATIRDGGLVNDFNFSDEFIRQLYKTNIDAGVDYMEFGYKCDKTMFGVDDFGKWKFCNDEDIYDIVGDNDTNLKISVMADVGRCNYKEDIHEKSNSPIDLVRVATYINTIPAAIDMIEDAHKKGYETSCNIMAISNAKESDINAALDMLGKSPVDTFYIVDSYGSIYPEEMERLCDTYNNFATKYNKNVGIHAHNNQQLAFANTIECVGDGVDYLDATYGGMGRGAGNCQMELLLGFLKNPKYETFPIFKFSEKYIQELKDQGVTWGYDLQYLMTGQLNRHPRSAIAFTKENRKDYCELYKELIDND